MTPIINSYIFTGSSGAALIKSRLLSLSSVLANLIRETLNCFIPFHSVTSALILRICPVLILSIPASSAGSMSHFFPLTSPVLSESVRSRYLLPLEPVLISIFLIMKKSVISMPVFKSVTYNSFICSSLFNRFLFTSSIIPYKPLTGKRLIIATPCSLC